MYSISGFFTKIL